LGVLVVLPFVPTLVARVGPVAGMATGCGIGAAGFLALYAFPSAWAWIAIRLLMSAGLALPWLTGETWINSVSSESSRGRVIAAYAVAFFLGFSIGPIALQRVGTVGLWPFLVGASGMALCMLPPVLAQRLAPVFHHEGSGRLSAALLAPVATIGGFIGGFTEMTCLTLIPNVALAAGLSQAAALNFLSMIVLGGILLQFPIGWLADKVRKATVMLAVTAALPVLLWALPFVIRVPLLSDLVAFLIGGVIFGFYTTSLAIIGERVAPRDLAAANAAFLVMYQVGAIIGPFAAGIGMSASPIVGFVATTTIVMPLCAVVVVAVELADRRRRTTAALDQATCG
jgi:MFS family permease